MQHFCTFFDSRYMSRGLALHASLVQHCPSFALWILCLDTSTYDCLSRMRLPQVYLLTMPELKQSDPEIEEASRNRSLVSLYFTCKPALALHVLRKCPEATRITYLDADLFFFADPAAIVEREPHRSVLVTPHRFAPAQRYLEAHGRYNAGWVSFSRDAEGMACLNWWRDRCIEWCHDVINGNRFADQKYIDDFPTKFSGVGELVDPGANLAPWNLGRHRLTWNGLNVRVDGAPLLFYHFHGLRRVVGRIYDAGLEPYSGTLTPVSRRRLYSPYLVILQRMSRSVGPEPPALTRITPNPLAQACSTDKIISFARRWLQILSAVRKGTYVVAPRLSL